MSCQSIALGFPAMICVDVPIIFYPHIHLIWITEQNFHNELMLHPGLSPHRSTPQRLVAEIEIFHVGFICIPKHDFHHELMLQTTELSPHEETPQR